MPSFRTFWQRSRARVIKRREEHAQRSHFDRNLRLDQKAVFSHKRRSLLPNTRQLKYLTRFYSPSEVLITKVAAFVLLASLVTLGTLLYRNNLERTGTIGGEYVEAVVGAPTYINPLYAQTNDIDQDLTELVFAGLMRLDEQGGLETDLAESYSVDEAHTTYTFVLRPELQWHDNVTLTAQDVAFTVQSIKDPNFKSPLYVTFRDVVVRVVDDRTISFTLPEPFAPFLSIMTFGILPEHLWSEVDPSHAVLAELNLKPVGAGAYRFASLSKDKNGNIREYRLERFANYHYNGPFIEQLTLKFFSSFEEAQTAVLSGNADGIGFIQKRVDPVFANSADWKQYSLSLPHYTALFFNQENNNILGDHKVREALLLATSKRQIVEQIFGETAQAVDGPIPPSFAAFASVPEPTLYDPARAATLLDEAGWKRIIVTDETTAASSTTPVIGDNTSLGLPETAAVRYSRQKRIRRDGKDENVVLEVTLTALNKGENIEVAEKVREFWQAVGVTVNLELVDLADIQKNIIKPRNYEVLLFGQILGRDPDPYPFWHSSQVSDPGLNLARYRNKDIDKLLEDARRTSDLPQRQELYTQFQRQIISDIPAVFLYSLNYTYLIPSRINGIATERINKPSDRFSNIYTWYIATKKRINWGSLVPQDWLFW